MPLVRIGRDARPARRLLPIVDIGWTGGDFRRPFLLTEHWSLKITILGRPRLPLGRPKRSTAGALAHGTAIGAPGPRWVGNLSAKGCRQNGRPGARQGRRTRNNGHWLTRDKEGRPRDVRITTTTRAAVTVTIPERAALYTAVSLTMTPSDQR